MMRVFLTNRQETRPTNGSLSVPGVICGLLVFAGLAGCGDNADHGSQPERAGGAEDITSVHPGKAMVNIHCVRCHLAPDPQELPKEVWPIVVSWMSHYVGFDGSELPGVTTTHLAERARSDVEVFVEIKSAAGLTNTTRLFSAFILPSQLMSNEELAAILDYFVSNSSAASEMRLARAKQPVLTSFTSAVPEFGLPPNGVVYSTLVNEEDRSLYFGRGKDTTDFEDGDDFTAGTSDDAVVGYSLESNKRIAYATLSTRPMNLDLTRNALRVSTHGVAPGNMQNGMGQVIDFEGFSTDEPRARMLVNGYHRIVQTHTRDIDGDGLDDLVVNGFGDGILHIGGGRLSVFWQTPEFSEIWQDAPANIPDGPLTGALRETILMERVGLISSAVADINNDGRPDIVLLTAQARHELYVFVNRGDGTFDRKLVMEWQPSFGSVRVNAADVNGDGKVDLIVLNGNNVELVTTRPQHGVRIFENNGDFSFTQRFSYAMPGAINSVTHDFDNDGDMDIAVIALWPDWNLAEPETFVYLENTGDWNFSPFSLESKDWGVWVSISVGDVNADQKADIVLGSGHFPFFRPDDWAEKPIMKGRDGKLPTIMFLMNDR